MLFTQQFPSLNKANVSKRATNICCSLGPPAMQVLTACSTMYCKLPLVYRLLTWCFLMDDHRSLSHVWVKQQGSRCLDTSFPSTRWVTSLCWIDPCLSPSTVTSICKLVTYLNVLIQASVPRRMSQTLIADWDIVNTSCVLGQKHTFRTLFGWPGNEMSSFPVPRSHVLAVRSRNKRQ